MDNIEIRNFNIEFRTDEDRHIEGYGAVFNSRSLDLGGFTEIIAPDAFNGVLENSDVKCYLDHNPQRGILARSRNGQGSLSLSTDETGLRYSFEAPHTALGDEVLEGLRRGDYSQSSFAFTVDSQTWTRDEDGKCTRTINKIKNLYDVSVVANPAYPDTSVACRSMEEFLKQEACTNEVPEVPEVPVHVDEVPEGVDEVRNSVNEVPEIENEEHRNSEDVLDTARTIIAESKEERDINNTTNTNKIFHMSKFSLIKTINDVVNNRSINEDALNVIEEGVKEMRKSGLSYSGQIQLPVEQREDPAPTDGAIVATVETQGAEVVATDKLHILDPLRANSILSEVGATFLTGLTGNLSIPTYSGSTVGWKGELVAADNGAGSFDTIEFSPKRLTAYIDISKQFLIQDSVGAEELLRRDIVNALRDKLEATIFGDEEGTNDRPAGIFYDAEEGTPSYAEVCELEENLDSANFLGSKRFVLSPKAKSQFKQTTVSGELSDLRLLLENNEINGYPVSSSSNVAGYAFGDWSELYVCQWGAIDLVVDPYTLATKNAVRLVINAFFDAKVRREGAIIAKVLDSGESD